MESKKILIVDDDEVFLNSVAQLLKNKGYEVTTFTDVVSAITSLINTVPDIIISDIMMPGINGYEFCERVREQKEYSHIPFIFLTAKNEKADIRKSKEIGADDYITKPFDPDDLYAIIENKLRRIDEIKSAEQEEKDRLKREILGSLSHEFRTSVTMIKGFSDLIIRDQSMDKEKLMHFLSIIKEESGRLESIIEDFLFLTQIELGKLELLKRDIDIETLVVNTAEKYRKRIEAGGLILNIDIQPSLPKISIDSIKIENALERLISNAIQFTDTGSITIRVERKDELIGITVEDTGKGIPKKELKKIFEKFYQSDRMKKRHRGLGIGLSIVKGIVEAHGGSIKVESEEGKGSKFTIWLRG